jgi:hypothetical protein
LSNRLRDTPTYLGNMTTFRRARLDVTTRTAHLHGCGDPDTWPTLLPVAAHLHGRGVRRLVWRILLDSPPQARGDEAHVGQLHHERHTSTKRGEASTADSSTLRRGSPPHAWETTSALISSRSRPGSAPLRWRALRRPGPGAGLREHLLRFSRGHTPSDCIAALRTDAEWTGARSRTPCRARCPDPAPRGIVPRSPRVGPHRRARRPA